MSLSHSLCVCVCVFLSVCLSVCLSVSRRKAPGHVGADVGPDGHDGDDAPPGEAEEESDSGTDDEGLPAELKKLFSECGGPAYAKEAIKQAYAKGLTPKPGHTQNSDTQDPRRQKPDRQCPERKGPADDSPDSRCQSEPCLSI